MKVLFVTPTYFPKTSGNATTVHRIATNLESLGVDVCVVSIEHGTSKLAKVVENKRVDLIHAFHAHRAGVRALAVANEIGVPLFVTLTGTDVNHDLYNEQRRASVQCVLQGSAAVFSFHQSIADCVNQEVPGLSGKLHVVQQGVWFPQIRRWELRSEWNFNKDDFIFFLPAGVRPVKQPLWAVAPLAKLRRRHSRIKLVIAGMPLDDDLMEELSLLCTRHSWMRYLGELPYEKMYSAFEAVDCVLNTSVNEGGMSNSILEAMAARVPVLAADVVGNRSIIKNGENGLLFGDEEEFIDKAHAVISDSVLRMALVENAFSAVTQELNPLTEAGHYLGHYQGVIFDKTKRQ